jgi:hypothetical protein
MEFLKKLKIELPCGPALPLLGMYPKQCKSAYNRHTCAPMFIVALFPIAKPWSHPRCASSKKWTKKT